MVLEIFKQLWSEVARANIRRAYGNFASQFATWEDTLVGLAIRPMQTFSVSARKNAADIALAVDAMDLLYTGLANRFCIVTSDSDFTWLATRLREHGAEVTVYGADKASPALRSASRFVPINTLINSPDAATAQSALPAPATEKTKSAKTGRLSLSEAAKLVVAAMKKMPKNEIDKNGWVKLQVFGTHLGQLYPNAHWTDYGASSDKPKALVRLFRDSTPYGIEVDSKVTKVRLKPV